MTTLAPCLFLEAITPMQAHPSSLTKQLLVRAGEHTHDSKSSAIKWRLGTIVETNTIISTMAITIDGERASEVRFNDANQANSEAAEIIKLWFSSITYISCHFTDI